MRIIFYRFGKKLYIIKKLSVLFSQRKVLPLQDDSTQYGGTFGFRI